MSTSIINIYILSTIIKIGERLVKSFYEAYRELAECSFQAYRDISQITRNTLIASGDQDNKSLLGSLGIIAVFIECADMTRYGKEALGRHDQVTPLRFTRALCHLEKAGVPYDVISSWGAIYANFSKFISNTWKIIRQRKEREVNPRYTLKGLCHSSISFEQLIANVHSGADQLFEHVEIKNEQPSTFKPVPLFDEKLCEALHTCKGYELWAPGTGWEDYEVVPKERAVKLIKEFLSVD